MNDSVKYSWLAGAAAIATILLAYFPARLLGLKGADFAVFSGGISLIGFGLIGAFLLPRILSGQSRAKSNTPAAGSAAPAGDNVGSLVRETEGKLGKKLASVPVLLVINSKPTANSGSLVENCGLELDRLSTFGGGSTWLSGDTVVVEVDPEAWSAGPAWGAVDHPGGIFRQTRHCCRP
jgi:hypothetical protein